MNRPDFPRGIDVPSPCVSVCEMDARTGRCKGCARTLEEIATWSVLDNNEKRTVLALIDERRLLRQ